LNALKILFIKDLRGKNIELYSNDQFSGASTYHLIKIVVQTSYLLFANIEFTLWKKKFRIILEFTAIVLDICIYKSSFKYTFVARLRLKGAITIR
jgi:hypothetical protein